MSKTIDLFMWGYQESFRIEMDIRAETVLERAGCNLKPKSFLVGVRVKEDISIHPVCVEPEHGDWEPKLFFDCEKRSNEIYKIHPGHEMFFGDAPSMQDKPENIRRDSVRASVEEVLKTYDEANNTISFCTRPTTVNGYYIVPILQFDKSEFDEYPSIRDPIVRDDFKPSSNGFLYSLSECLLEEASKELVQKDPGRFLGFLRTDPTTMLKHAGRDLCSAIGLMTQDILMQDAFELINNISSLSYEGASTIGTLIFSNKENLREFRTKMELVDPVPLREAKLVRKILEMCMNELHCLYVPEKGIAKLGEIIYSSTVHIKVEFLGHYKWQLFIGNRLVMLSSYGVPHIPSETTDQDSFKKVAKRIFPKIDNEDLDVLLVVVRAAIDQKHGALIVVTDEAKKETLRLSKQCIRINPILLNTDMSKRLCRIDGAILIDTKGVCHAVGVILDGTATDQADMSRGARYNSALRYISSSSKPSLCIVISEDGYVNILDTASAK